jgi:hypothetical protein
LFLDHFFYRWLSSITQTKTQRKVLLIFLDVSSWRMKYLEMMIPGLHMTQSNGVVAGDKLLMHGIG